MRRWKGGSPEQVAAVATRLDINLTRHRLRAQFRCDESDEYMRRADARFGLTEGEGALRVAYPRHFRLR